MNNLEAALKVLERYRGMAQRETVSGLSLLQFMGDYTRALCSEPEAYLGWPSMDGPVAKSPTTVADSTASAVTPTASEQVYVDKHGQPIKVGDVLYNSFDAKKYHAVIADSAGDLFLGDLDSPLGEYQPGKFWEIQAPKSTDRSDDTCDRPGQSEETADQAVSQTANSCELGSLPQAVGFPPRKPTLYGDPHMDIIDTSNTLPQAEFQRLVLEGLRAFAIVGKWRSDSQMVTDLNQALAKLEGKDE